MASDGFLLKKGLYLERRLTARPAVATSPSTNWGRHPRRSDSLSPVSYKHLTLPPKA